MEVVLEITPGWQVRLSLNWPFCHRPTADLWESYTDNEGHVSLKAFISLSLFLSLSPLPSPSPFLLSSLPSSFPLSPSPPFPHSFDCCPGNYFVILKGHWTWLLHRIGGPKWIGQSHDLKRVATSLEDTPCRLNDDTLLCSMKLPGLDRTEEQSGRGVGLARPLDLRLLFPRKAMQAG